VALGEETTGMKTDKLREKRFGLTVDPTYGHNAESLARTEANRQTLKAHGWTAVRDLRERDLVPEHAQRPLLERGRVVRGLLVGEAAEAAHDIFDHPYSLVHYSGLVIYVGEPYPFPLEQALPKLPVLCGEKYKAVLRSDLTLHNPLPNGTTAVWFYRNDETGQIEALLPKKGA
jgi:hypothetical protein